jgi:hypothetical protein
MICRHCKSPNTHKILNLGVAPPSNAYVTAEKLCSREVTYPLVVRVCHHCWLVQTEDYTIASDLFDSSYAYFSSTSTSWLKHANSYFKKISHELGLGSNSLVIEIASNDGYLLKNFVDAKIPCLGIEPTNSTADAAEKVGVPTAREFFTEKYGRFLAQQGKQADLIIGNNVYAHVPNINDFTLGIKAVMKPTGIVTLEFPHLMQMLEKNQFDTVYHEHFSYLSLSTVKRIFSFAGLRIWRVEKLDTHGGSLRIYGCHEADNRLEEESVEMILSDEVDSSLLEPSGYSRFQINADKIKNDFLQFLLEKKQAGKTVAAYGAAAKGNTLINYAGVKPDLIEYVCDAAGSKQGKWLPGSRIPILHPSELNTRRPDFVVILPWNIAAEIQSQNKALESMGVRFVIAVPRLTYLPPIATF